MLHHTGQKRTYKHNLRLAALLCLTAGLVNISGLSGFFVLTTNVTGHAALFAQRLSHQEFQAAIVVGLWMLAFLLGAFTSGLYIKKIGSEHRNAYTFPIVCEMAILLLVGTFGHRYNKSTLETEYFAGSLLFAMGMQNAMVTMISGSVVRTTHLTGMFTDLGIDLSTYFSGEKKNETVNRKIILRLVIIFSFLAGGIMGGYLFVSFGYHTFYFPAGILFIVMFYDYFRFKALKILNRLKS